LDTCAVLWTASGERMSERSRQAIDMAAPRDGVFVSPVSAWEIGTLVRAGRVALSMPPEAWFDAMLALPGMMLAPMSPPILIASAFLPGSPPDDPADRIIVATARAENLLIVTRDRKLLCYADAGHVRAVEC
jgi:PIN domain nuclease of toxin-antitoxin system